MVRFSRSSSSSPSRGTAKTSLKGSQKASLKSKGTKPSQSNSLGASKTSSKTTLKISSKKSPLKSTLLRAGKSFPDASKGTKEPKASLKKGAPTKAQKIDSDRALLAREEQKIRTLEKKIRLKEEAARRRLEELPKKLEVQRRKQQEMLRLQLATAPTRPDGLRRLRDKRHPLKQGSRKTGGARMAERRSARIQFILLCVILLTILFLIWHSLPS